MAGALSYMFVARSVSVGFSPANTTHELSGNLLFELGGTYLALPGDYQLKASAPGYQDLIVDIEVGLERNQYHEFELTKKPGRISFGSAPSGALVIVNGEALGTTPLTDQLLEAGDYSLYMRLERYEDHAGQVLVEGLDRAQAIEVSMRPDWADVEVTSTPAGARVSLDGMTTELVTPATVPVPSGFAELTLKLSGYKSFTTDLEVVARKPQTLQDAELELADGLLNLVTNPSGAGITANGRFYGSSPAELSLRPGTSYKIQVYKAGFERIARTLQIKRGEQQLQLKLTPLIGEVAVEVDPPDAILSVDGKIFKVANQTLRLSVAPHVIALSKPGYAGYQASLTPKKGLTQQLRVKLLTLEEARVAALKPKRSSSAGDELILLTGGKLTMGASRREPGRRANEVLHPVTLTRPFYLASKEVSNRQFQAFGPGHDSGEFEDNKLNKPDQPVVGLRWLDAALYCNWLSKQDKLEPFYKTQPGAVTGIVASATGYRLPTEAEWAFAARTQADDTAILRFPWGAKLPPPDRHGNYADRSATHVVGRIIFGYNDNHIVSAPVGNFGVNQYGLFDLGGNVAEWTHDFYTMPTVDATVDPLGPVSGEYHSIRGSSWRHGTVSDLRLAFRDYGIDGRNDVGFRIARYAE
jgi:formylglycine-generating enzyme required for sulfatase activity